MITPILQPRSEDSYVRTFTGAKFWPLNPRPEDVRIKDIAHALAYICRFTGHTYCHYSVADHSLRISHLAEGMALHFARTHYFAAFDRIFFARQVALWGLLHDASEAYLCDLPSPIKHFSDLGVRYRIAEDRLMQVIASHFGLAGPEPKIVKHADKALLHTEMRDLIKGQRYDRALVLRERISPLSAEEAEERFLLRFKDLWSATQAERIAAKRGRHA
jgi:hypothetical protein